MTRARRADTWRHCCAWWILWSVTICAVLSGCSQQLESPPDPEPVSGSSTSAADVRLLFIGNSFTEQNRLDHLVAELFRHHGPGITVHAISTAPGGYRWRQHQEDLVSPRSESQIRQLLENEDGHPTPWDWVILQEQSQILGFDLNEAEVAASLEAAEQFGMYFADRDTQIVLLMTWGYAEQDHLNPERFSSFSTMQSHLQEGYIAASNVIRRTGCKVSIAPAGLAFAAIHEDARQHGIDPLAEGTLFQRLYASDGKHPSLLGSYLAACTVAATILQSDVTPVDWAPSSIASEDAAALRRFADQADSLQFAVDSNVPR